MLQICFGLPVGTYRLGIVLMSDDTQSEQKLNVVELSSNADPNVCISDTTFGQSF